MFMDGFHSIFEKDISCINLFFSGWTLNTPIKFTCACLGVILLGFFTEGILFSRHAFFSKYKGSVIKRRISQFILHFFCSILGYLVMLIAMVYNIELLFSLCFGLALGYDFFRGASLPPPTSLEPCCRTIGEGDDLIESSGSGVVDPLLTRKRLVKNS